MVENMPSKISNDGTFGSNGDLWRELALAADVAGLDADVVLRVLLQAGHVARVARLAVGVPGGETE